MGSLQHVPGTLYVDMDVDLIPGLMVEIYSRQVHHGIGTLERFAQGIQVKYID
ncbi:hypothetical protein D9M71_165770 [compost metagenome]